MDLTAGKLLCRYAVRQHIYESGVTAELNGTFRYGQGIVGPLEFDFRIGTVAGADGDTVGYRDGGLDFELVGPVIFYAFRRDVFQYVSGGQKQRVGIARAIMQEPKLLLCDEPIASLDPNASKIIMDLIYQMTQRRNIACIVNLHQLDVAMRYATRIIGLAKGEMIFDGTPQQLNNAVIEKIYNTSMENLIIKQGENYA